MMWGAGTLGHCWWERKFCSYFVENCTKVPYKSINSISYDSSNKVLDIYTKGLISVSQRDIRSPKSTASFSTTA